ncbi:dynamin family protein [Knoellia aerolata]|uniref:ABC transporter n=1 Tax=Knoellia aerolata DSM 18566 TaxID=1385519 RepID=A0A0A0JS31_9MICO|nr:dynamin family protein [Knoellia aerolata]KGN39968.1 ABC transporter [Knoellia aerolata DSM 18566]
MTASDTARASVLVEAVAGLRDAVEASVLPLSTPGQAPGLAVRKELLDQLDDYVLPRLRSIDAPLLAVVGGSTGAGKSTLVNSIVGARVSRSGVLRPTTTSPVLVHHPQDQRWFADQRILPSLARVTGGPGEEGQPGTVRLVPSSTLPAGMALLDAPDIDSVVQANRELATQLLSAADLWLFVTTAARYADAVPWDLLRTAAERGTAVAIVLDRIAPEAVDEIRPHLASMLREQGLPTAPIFTVPESDLTSDGFLPPESMGRLTAWLDALASDSRARAVVVSQTLKGAMDSLSGRTSTLARASDEQAAAARALTAAAADNYDHATEGVKDGMTDGTLLRGEVLARWQEFVGTGEFFRQIESTLSKWRDKITASIKGQPAPAEDLGEALQSGVANLLVSHASAASADTAREWRRLPGGEALLAAHPELAKPSPDFNPRVEAMVRQWQGEVFDIVRSEGGNRRTNARIAAYGVNAIGLFLMLVSFAATGGLTGAEVGIAGGTSVLAQRVLEAIFGDQAVREMAAKARRSLLDHVETLYAAEQDRYAAAVAAVGDTDQQSAALNAAATRVREVNA